MSEEQIVYHCAPTLAGIKTGNLFSCGFEDRRQVVSEIRRLNRMLVPKGVRVLPIRYSEEHVLVYAFRPSALKRDLSSNEAKLLLDKMGYGSRTTEQCIVELIRRLDSREVFPHEIGLFLGYPPEDVKGFIENKSRNYKCVGCWKVYGNEENALTQFERFVRCTDCYCKQYRSGIGIDRLTVVV